MTNPYILMDKDHIQELWPTKEMSYTNKFNAITRLVILLSVLGFLVLKSLKFLLAGVLTITVMVFLFKRQRIQEPFTVEPPPLAPSNFTQPTMKNPLMNVLLPELNGDPKRKQAAESFDPSTEKNINESVRQQNKIDPLLFQGIKNDIDLEMSMRQFYTNPNTTVPSKQDEFAQFCYGGMLSAKEGDPLALERKNPRTGGVNH